MEVGTSEFFPVIAEIHHALENLSRWTRPVKIDAPLTFIGTGSEVRHEPKGVCLIISPWNYPFNLSIGPLVSCIAAGNTAMLKPSELTPHTSAFISKLAGEVFDNDVVAVVEGDANVASGLLQLPFDHIFFTGSPAVGKIVMRAAAERLASVTLELGGKSPAIVDSTANLKDAAKRIAFGKFLNNGQTCIAPDYVLVDNSIKEKFVELLVKNVKEIFSRSEDYGKIVSAKHFKRLRGLADDAVKKGATTVLKNELNESTLSFPPMVLTNASNDMLVMQEEIFGPILPVVAIDIKESTDFINARPKPLALYVFSHDRGFRESVFEKYLCWWGVY